MYYKELIGTQVNQWTVLGKDENSSSKTKMICRCSCGRIRSVDGYSLKHGLTKSCGKCSLITDEGDHMRCTLKNGTSFLFDRDDLDLVESHTWSIARGYVRTTMRGKTVYFHRLVMGVSEEEVDHVNMDRLDNRKSNLRLATHAENQQNRRMHRDNKSGFKGVCLDTRSGKYFAYINADNRRTYLGHFNSKEEAYEAYDRAALKLHKDFARTNYEIGGRRPNEEFQEILELA